MKKLFSPYRTFGTLASVMDRSGNCRLRAPALSGRLRTVTGGRGTGTLGDVVLNVCEVPAMPGLRCGSDPPQFTNPEWGSAAHAD